MFKQLLLFSLLIYFADSRGNKSPDSLYNNQIYIQFIHHGWPNITTVKINDNNLNYPIYLDNWINSTVINKKIFDASSTTLLIKTSGIYIFYATLTFKHQYNNDFQNHIKVKLNNDIVLTGIGQKVLHRLFTYSQISIYGVLNIRNNSFLSLISLKENELLLTNPSLTYWGLIKL